MTDKAIVRSRGDDPAGFALEDQLARAAPSDVEVEHVRSDGALVRADEEGLDELARRGMRVKVFTDTNLLRVGEHVIDVEADDVIADVPSRLRVPRAERASWPHHLVQLAGPPAPEWIDAIVDAGVDVVEPLGQCGLFVCGTPDAAEAVGDLPFVAWVGPLQPMWRIGPGLSDLRGDVRVRIGVCPPDQSDAVAEAITELGGDVHRVEHTEPGGARTGTLHRYGLIEATIAAGTARNDVSRLPSVRYVDHAPPDELEDERSAQVLTESFAGGSPAGPTVTGYADELADYGVDGSGTTIAVTDSGIDDHNNATIHPDLRGRFAFFADQTGGTVPTDANGHGTHVAAIAAGDGSTGNTDPGGFVLGLGVAPGARVGSINAITGAATTTVATWLATAVQNGAEVSNNSWGAGNGGSGYTARAGTVDGAVRDPDTSTTQFERLTVVFSAGNNGGNLTSVTEPKEAKNVIVVGNSLTSRPDEMFPDDDVRGINGRSSRGPAVDGRILPTLVAPGTDIVAARSTIDADPSTPGVQPNRPAYTDTDGTVHDQHTQMSGTSMAAPHVAGTVALLVERWRQRTGQDPSPALVRALLVNTAEDLAGGPNWFALFRWWTTAGANFQVTGFGFAPAQLAELNFGAGTWQTLTEVANVAAIDGPGQWAYTAATDTITVRTTTGGRPYVLGPNNVGIHILDPDPVANVPNNDQGWGRVSLENLLVSAPASDRGPRIVVDQRLGFTANGEEWTLRVAPVDPDRPMRVTLAWTDAPAASGANPALVNDLDLEVAEDATGSVYLGNVLTNGFSVPGGGADDLHNLECVYIEHPSGVYDVSVIASALRADARPPFDADTPWQDFALVLDNAEIPAADPVDVALAIDRSGSMNFFGYVDATRTAARGFVDMLAIDDGVGVATFGSTAQDEFPGETPPSVRRIVGQADRDDATAAIDAITFGGTTEMGPGLQTAADMLDGSSGTRAVVLLSDGYDNGSPDARTVAGGLSSGITVHTCAMGPTSDQELLEDVAASTDGLYLYMPTIDDLFLLLNVIREQVTGTGLIVNSSNTASESRIGAWVEEEADEVTFLVNLDDPNLRWTPGDPGNGEIAVRLRSPNGRLLHSHEPTVYRSEGSGYVGFRVPDPLPGQWWVEIATGRRRHTRYTVGGFVRSPVRIDVGVGSGVRGRPLDIEVCASDSAGPIREASGTLCVTAPTRSPQGALDRFAARLRGKRITTTVKGDVIPERFRPLVTLDRLLRREDLAAIDHQTRCVPLRRSTSPPTVGWPGRLPGGTTVPGAGSTPSVTVGGTDPAVTGSVAPGGGVRDPLAARVVGTDGPRIDPRLRLDPRLRFDPRLRLPSPAEESLCLSAQWPGTSVPGSYNATIEVHGQTAAGSRFVRTTIRSVRVR